MKKSIELTCLLLFCFFATGCSTGLVVDSSGDEPDINLSDGECKTVNNDCTLRAAIMEANILDDVSKITFDNVTAIYPLSPLPELTSSNTHINGDGLVTLVGSQIAEGHVSGLLIRDSSYNIIQGLIIRDFSIGITINSHQGTAKNNKIGTLISNPGDGSERNIIILNNVGISLSGQDTFENTVSGNYIGIKKNGSSLGPNEIGVSITSGAHDNLIGCLSGTDVSTGWNLISGNTVNGLYLSEAFQNHISGNFIGTNIHGTTPKSNFIGIKLTNGSTDNVIGVSPDVSGKPNLISGNLQFGIDVDNNSSNNVIAGNLIGTDIDGTSGLGNGWAGVYIKSAGNRIGTNADGTSDLIEVNIISGNGTSGISLSGPNNHVAGNIIGLDITGTSVIGNGLEGISINWNDNLIGTNGDGVNDSAERNIISGNSDGINIIGEYNTVAGNYIGTDITGSVGVGNLQQGITIGSWDSGNIIGTNGDGSADEIEGNLISGNGQNGIWLTFESYENTVAGNIIGADLNGSTAIPNCQAISSDCAGIKISGNALKNVIGTNSDGINDAIEGNLISGNAGQGIILSGYWNFIAGNKIGTDISGSSALPNNIGIELYVEGTGGFENRIGTDGDGSSDFAEMNLISGNHSAGIRLRGHENSIAGNFIGTDISGSSDLGNGKSGIVIEDTSTKNVIGGSVQKTNIIAFNSRFGVEVEGDNTDQNLITYNSIHSNDEIGINHLSLDGYYGITPNDPGDLDSGPNDLLNFPVLSDASSITGFVSVHGEIVNSLPFTSYNLQFFRNDDCDPSGHGEGKTYLGSKLVFTDYYGNASFNGIFSGVVPAGNFITATATAYGNTSEFSNCVEVTAGEQTYSGELEENPCDQFNQDDMSLVTFEYRPGSGIFSLYLKNPEPYPIEGPAGLWEYTAVLGEVPSSLTSFLEFDDRAYFDFVIPESYLNTTQTLKVFSNYCFPPLYVTDVGIYTKDPTGPSGTDDPGSCSSDLGPRACDAAGGTISYANGTCICPRY